MTLASCTSAVTIGNSADGEEMPVTTFQDIRSPGDGRVGDGLGNTMMLDSISGQPLARKGSSPRYSTVRTRSHIGPRFSTKPT
jgi:hypothetical protein